MVLVVVWLVERDIHFVIQSSFFSGRVDSFSGRADSYTSTSSCMVGGEGYSFCDIEFLFFR